MSDDKKPAFDVRKYKDWAAWREGLRTKVVRAGAEAIATNIAALIGTNGVASMNIPGLEDIGLKWKTAVCILFTQFILRTVLAAAIYIQSKPDADVIVIDENGTHTEIYQSDTTMLRKTVKTYTDYT